VTHAEVGRRPAGHPVLLQYVLAREGNKGPVLFTLPLGFDEEALVVQGVSLGPHRGEGEVVGR
jgi:hypothetical protein